MPYQGQNKCQLIRETSEFVISQSKHVTINQKNIEKIAEKFNYKKFNQFTHHEVSGDDQASLRYLFVLDSCNFCFWPLKGFQYEQLAGNILKYINSGVALEKLARITEEELVNEMFSGIKVPLAKQRARMVRQVCSITLQKFGGSFVKIVEQANKSAVQLLNILTSNFPNFQDHQIYRGHQVFFFKRAQLLVTGIWGRFDRKGLGQFTDIDQLTVFADYRVPQLLNEYGILEYTKELQQKINGKVELCSGCEEEVEIRAATVVTVERMKKYLNEKLGKSCMSVEVDQFLWQMGESMLDSMIPHHRTLTIFY